VFILSRVKELVDRGGPTDEAVARGIRWGVGLAVAVLLDATLIRGVLLPAAMKLLGDWNWYLPRWLEWVPRLTVEPALREEIPEAPAVPAA
jgi:uncharacterized membrane protein YdfJ with MMPL/SSD domain